MARWLQKYQMMSAKNPAAIAASPQTISVNRLRKGPMTNNQLKAFVERLEKLDEEKAVLAEDFKSVLSEAKSSGFDTKIIKKILAMRKQDAHKLREEQALLSTYLDALGMLADTPLGQAALKAAKPSKAAPVAESDIDEDDGF